VKASCLCEPEVTTGKFQIADYVGNILLRRKETVSKPTRTLNLGNDFKIFISFGTYHHASIQRVDKCKKTPCNVVTNIFVAEFVKKKIHMTYYFVTKEPTLIVNIS
jgi:hypothetical protein